MSLFRLDASILPTSSASRSLADLVEAEWLSAHPDSSVVRRDLSLEPVPATAWPDAVTGGFAPEADRTDSQRAARALDTTLADELINAEALLFAVPLYNYGVSQHFKTWFDLAYTDPRIDPQGTALRGKPATLVTVLGGNYAPGTPKEGWDHSTSWLRRVLEDVWGTRPASRRATLHAGRRESRSRLLRRHRVRVEADGRDGCRALRPRDRRSGGVRALTPGSRDVRSRSALEALAVRGGAAYENRARRRVLHPRRRAPQQDRPAQTSAAGGHRDQVGVEVFGRSD